MNESSPSSNRGAKWWHVNGGNQPKKDCEHQPVEREPCPSCLIGQLVYNGLFQLICDNCGRVAEHAVFT